MAKFIYSSRVSNWAELFSVWKYLCAYSRAPVSWSCLPGHPWHSLTYDVRRLTGRSLTQGLSKERAGLFSPARPLRQGWTGLRKVLGFNLSRKVFSKLFLTIWIWCRSSEESPCPEHPLWLLSTQHEGNHWRSQGFPRPLRVRQCRQVNVQALSVTAFISPLPPKRWGSRPQAMWTPRRALDSLASFFAALPPGTQSSLWVGWGWKRWSSAQLPSLVGLLHRGSLISYWVCSLHEQLSQAHWNPSPDLSAEGLVEEVLQTRYVHGFGFKDTVKPHHHQACLFVESPLL